MFGAGWTEMLIIGIVALVVIGPKDLPVVMRKLGRVVRTVRRMGEEFQSELSKTTGLDQITDLKRSITEPLRQSSDDIMREFNRQTSTGVEPTGIMKPTDPQVESVYDQIAQTSGLTPANAVAPVDVSDVSPAPVEAAPVEASVLAKPRKPRKTVKAASVTVALAEPAAPLLVNVDAPSNTETLAVTMPTGLAEAREPASKPRARPRKSVAEAPVDGAASTRPAIPVTTKRTSRGAASVATPASRQSAKKT